MGILTENFSLAALRFLREKCVFKEVIFRRRFFAVFCEMHHGSDTY